MGLTVESIGQQVPSHSNETLIRPEASDDMELSSLLSGSGNFKTTGEDEIGKYLKEPKTEKNDKLQKAGDILLDCIPSILSAGVGYKFSHSKVVLITCLVSNLATIGIKMLKNKRAEATA